LAAQLVLGLIQLLLIAALSFLLIVSIRMVRVHFIVKYGFPAWILPIAITLITLLLLFRFLRFWKGIREEYRDARGAGSSR